MGDAPLKVLLIEDNPVDARIFREALSSDAEKGSFALEWVDRLQTGTERLAQGGIQAVLLDLFLPDSQGLETFDRLRSEAPQVPAVVLTTLDDEQFALRTVRKGAQDYLVKGQVDGRLLPRVVRYAVERHRMQEALRSLALMDELTGLHNRRGFLTLAEQQVRVARRVKTPLALFLGDLDGLKRINDGFGHLEGDQALRQAAQALKKTFRASDIAARVGGDEFAVLAMDVSEDSAAQLLERLRENLAAANARGLSYRLSLSTGLSFLDPAQDPAEPPGDCIQALLAKADAGLYNQKHGPEDRTPLLRRDAQRNPRSGQRHAAF